MRKFLLSACILLMLGAALAVARQGGPGLAARADAAAMVYHGNQSSHVFHRPGCRYFNCKNCVVVFGSRQEALAAGFRPCKICNP